MFVSRKFVRLNEKCALLTIDDEKTWVSDRVRNWFLLRSVCVTCGKKYGDVCSESSMVYRVKKVSLLEKAWSTRICP